MVVTQTQTEKAFFELLNTYPSPHNGQPMVLKRVSEANYELFFDTSRGLTSTDISYLFSFVSVGVFARYIELVAQALGHRATVSINLPEHEKGMAGPGLLRCGTVQVMYAVDEPDAVLEAAIRFRQTSRKKYHSGLTNEEKEQLITLAAQYSFTAEALDSKQAHQTVWLNQRAVFDDMFNSAVRKELMHWLRFSHAEKMKKKDGLSFDCMELSGSALRFFCQNYRLLHWPVVAPLLKQYYLRTMKDASTVAYVSAPFHVPHDAYMIGRFITDAWLDLSKKGAYLHPFGTIVSNELAHADFVRLVGLSNEQREDNYVVFIFRAGRSSLPVRSERLAPNEHLIREEKNV